jgi:predicted enzyme related to lactoylglutathione lyase
MSDNAPNTPIWIDLASPDVEGSKSFYGGLFGWEAETVAPPEYGSYTMFKLDGKMVGAVATMQQGQHPAWSTYIGTEDADATVEKVLDAGGEIALKPDDVMEDGRIAIFRDSSGAFLSLWQPKNHKGFQVRDEPGTFGWTELATRDIEDAKRFYAAVFGWGAETTGEGAAAYTEWQVDGKSIAGAMTMGPDRPAEIPPHWLVYFAAADVDASAAKAGELGGSTVVPGMDFPGGRFAVIRDLQGAMFGLMRLEH